MNIDQGTDNLLTCCGKDVVCKIWGCKCIGLKPNHMIQSICLNVLIEPWFVTILFSQWPIIYLLRWKLSEGIPSVFISFVISPISIHIKLNHFIMRQYTPALSMFYKTDNFLTSRATKWAQDIICLTKSLITAWA